MTHPPLPPPLPARRDEQIEAMARAICAVWDYNWDGNPDSDTDGVPERSDAYDERPSKELYRRAAVAALAAASSSAGDGWVLVDRSELDKVFAGLIELANPKNLPRGTRDERCRRDGMVLAYGLAAKMVGALKMCPRAQPPPTEAVHG